MHSTEYFLMTKQQYVLRLRGAEALIESQGPSLPKLFTGDRVNVRAHRNGSLSTVTEVKVMSITRLDPPNAEDAPSSTMYSTTPRVVADMSTIFMLVDFCGKGGGPATTTQVRGPMVCALLMRSLCPGCTCMLAQIENWGLSMWKIVKRSSALDLANY